MTTSCSSLPLNSNSTPPAVFGAPKALAQMSLKAFDSRGARVNWICGAVAGQATVAMKQRYVAVTASGAAVGGVEGPHIREERRAAHDRRRSRQGHDVGAQRGGAEKSRNEKETFTHSFDRPSGPGSRIETMPRAAGGQGI